MGQRLSAHLTHAGVGSAFLIAVSQAWEVHMYDTRQKECNKHAAALISTAYRAPRLSLRVCQTSRKCAVL